MSDELAPRELYLRSATAVEVRHAERLITMVACPYDEDADVYWRGRWLTESVAPGSFDGVETRARRVHLNRDHDKTRTCGHGVKFHSSRTEGLVTDMHVARTLLGDETLELAADGILFGSVGFSPMSGGETYTRDRSRRRITKAFLDHVAMVSEPAYLGAQVLAVRSRDEAVPAIEIVSTPNLDRILAERSARGYSPLP